MNTARLIFLLVPLSLAFSQATKIRNPQIQGVLKHAPRATDPPTCSAGDEYFNTTSGRVRICPSLNTWADARDGLSSYAAYADDANGTNCSLTATGKTHWKVLSLATEPTAGTCAAVYGTTGWVLWKGADGPEGTPPVVITIAAGQSTASTPHGRASDPGFSKTATCWDNSGNTVTASITSGATLVYATLGTTLSYEVKCAVQVSGGGSTGGGQVSSVYGRTGAVTATAGDYTATQITNTPAGNVAATTAQAAINELDTEKQAALGFTPENSANKGQINGYAGLGADGKVPAAQLPASSGSGHTLSDGTTTFPSRTYFRILGSARTCSDNAGADATECTFNAGAATAGGTDGQFQLNIGGALAGRTVGPGLICDGTTCKVDPAAVPTFLTTTASVTFNGGAAIAAGACSSQTVALTGAAVNDVVTLGPPAEMLNFNLQLQYAVTDPNVVTLRLCNNTAGALTPTAALTWRVTVLRSF